MKRCVHFSISCERNSKRSYCVAVKVATLSLSVFQAKTHVCDIEQRLQGVIKSRNKVVGLPLSIEGHVHYLIQEATDDKLLCQMYLGWGPYL